MNQTPKFMHNKQKSTNESKPYLQDLTHSSKIPSNKKTKEELEPVSPSSPCSPFSPSFSESGFENDLWCQTEKFYGIPEDVAEYEDIDEEAVSKNSSFFEHNRDFFWSPFFVSWSYPFIHHTFSNYSFKSYPFWLTISSNKKQFFWNTQNQKPSYVFLQTDFVIINSNFS